LKPKTIIAEPRRELFPGLKNAFANTGEATVFAIRFFKEVFLPPYEWKELLKQCYKIGFKSFTLVAIAPVITALICAGKISSGIGAELGSMKVTEQIDAMEVSGINPFKYLVVTRIVAATLMIPLLVIFADAVGIVGSYVGVNIHNEVSTRRFFDQAIHSLDFVDLIPATVKTFFFGFFIGYIGCFKGYTAAQGTESVGKAANSAVVTASLGIFIMDMLAVQITDIIY